MGNDSLAMVFCAIVAVVGWGFIEMVLWIGSKISIVWGG